MPRFYAEFPNNTLQLASLNAQNIGWVTYRETQLRPIARANKDANNAKAHTVTSAHALEQYALWILQAEKLANTSSNINPESEMNNRAAEIVIREINAPIAEQKVGNFLQMLLEQAQSFITDKADAYAREGKDLSVTNLKSISAFDKLVDLMKSLTGTDQRDRIDVKTKMAHEDLADLYATLELLANAHLESLGFAQPTAAPAITRAFDRGIKVNPEFARLATTLQQPIAVAPAGAPPPPDSPGTLRRKRLAAINKPLGQ